MKLPSHTTKPKNNIRTFWITSAFVMGLSLVGVACGQNPAASPIPTAEPTINMRIVDYMVAADVLGIVVDDQMNVVHVEKGSGAESAGVQLGDTLDSVDGISFAKDKDKAKQRVREEKMDKKLKLKVKRNQETIELDVVVSPPVPQSGMDTPTAVPPTQDYY